MGHGAHTSQRALRARDHLCIRTYHPGCFRAELESLFNGALPGPMQAALQTGPTLYNRLEEYMEHVRDTGRGHLAEDLMERLHPNNGATNVSWHAPVPLHEEDRAAMRKRRAASIMAQE